MAVGEVKTDLRVGPEMRIWINGYGRLREWINGYRRLETMDMDIGPSWGREWI